MVPNIWDKVSGLYPCGEALGEPGWVRIHANFAHQPATAPCAFLAARQAPTPTARRFAQALRHWRAIDFETAAAEAGVVVAAVRSHDEWLRHPQQEALAALPTIAIERLEGDAEPLALAPLADKQAPLDGVRVLDLTRILAGPIACRTLAAYGADVLLVNSPLLPNIDAIAETSRGKRSTHIDLRTAAGRTDHERVAARRPCLRAGVSARCAGRPRLQRRAELARLRPGLVVASSLSAYGSTGPWAGRRGFDSLVLRRPRASTTTRHAPAGAAQPQAMPLQILDYAAGFLMAFGVQAALRRQRREGGSWHVQVSLAGRRTLAAQYWPGGGGICCKQTCDRSVHGQRAFRLRPPRAGAPLRGVRANACALAASVDAAGDASSRMGKRLTHSPRKFLAGVNVV